jgi:hypothetical protein
MSDDLLDEEPKRALRRGIPETERSVAVVGRTGVQDIAEAGCLMRVKLERVYKKVEKFAKRIGGDAVV